MDIVGILVAIAAVLYVAFTVFFALQRKRAGKSSCGCDCPSKQNGGCAYCPKSKDLETFETKEKPN